MILEWLLEKMTDIAAWIAVLFFFLVFIPGMIWVVGGVVLHMIGVFTCDQVWCL